MKPTSPRKQGSSWIRRSRLAAGWSPVELAQRSGLSVKRIHQLEAGSIASAKEQARIEGTILADRRARASLLIEHLARHFSQRHLELRLGLSQGYLSRLRAGSGNPSPALLSLLALLAVDPTRLHELDRDWSPPPESETPRSAHLVTAASRSPPLHPR